METEGKDVKQPMIFKCNQCGNQLEIRKFATDEGFEYGIFDNCTPFTEQYIYPSIKQAIEAFDG